MNIKNDNYDVDMLMHLAHSSKSYEEFCIKCDFEGIDNILIRREFDSMVHYPEIEEDECIVL